MVQGLSSLLKTLHSSIGAVYFLMAWQWETKWLRNTRCFCWGGEWDASSICLAFVVAVVEPIQTRHIWIPPFDSSIQMAPHILSGAGRALPFIDPCSSHSTHAVASCSILPLDGQEPLRFFLQECFVCISLPPVSLAAKRSMLSQAANSGISLLKNTWMPLQRGKTQGALTDKSWKRSALFCFTFSVDCEAKLYCLTKQSCSSQMLWQTDGLLLFFFKKQILLHPLRLYRQSPQLFTDF